MQRVTIRSIRFTDNTNHINNTSTNNTNHTNHTSTNNTNYTNNTSTNNTNHTDLFMWEKYRILLFKCVTKHGRPLTEL